MTDILVHLSPGELLDKITILRIKVARIQDAGKLANVKLELGLLEQTWKDCGAAAHDLSVDEHALHKVNEQLWDIEDRILDKEAKQTFDRDFIDRCTVGFDRFAPYLLGEIDGALRKALLAAAGDESAFVRAAAVRILGRIAGETKIEIPRVIVAFNGASA